MLSVCYPGACKKTEANSSDLFFPFFFFFRFYFFEQQEMGLMDKLRTQNDLRKVNKYTGRRLSQTHFPSHDRHYYDIVYRDGVYLDPSDIAPQHKPRWSLSSLWKKRPSTSLAASQYKTSETYTLNTTG